MKKDLKNVVITFGLVISMTAGAAMVNGHNVRALTGESVKARAYAEKELLAEREMQLRLITAGAEQLVAVRGSEAVDDVAPAVPVTPSAVKTEAVAPATKPTTPTTAAGDTAAAAKAAAAKQQADAALAAQIAAAKAAAAQKAALAARTQTQTQTQARQSRAS